MKLTIRQKGSFKIPIYVPNRLVLWVIKRKWPELPMDSKKVLKELRRYRGMTILEFEERKGEYVRIKL